MPTSKIYNPISAALQPLPEYTHTLLYKYFFKFDDFNAMKIRKSLKYCSSCAENASAKVILASAKVVLANAKIILSDANMANTDAKMIFSDTKMTNVVASAINADAK